MALDTAVERAPTTGTARVWASALLVLAAGVWLWIALWGMGAGILGALWPSVDTWLITSGSMEPALSAGDLVITAPPDDDVTYDAPTVVVFPDGDRFVTHRIVDVVDGAYRTQGDANADPDARLVPRGEVEGIGRVVIPWVGLPIHWWRAGQWWWALLALGSVAGAWAIVRYALPEEHHDDGQGDGARGSSTPSVVVFALLAVALAAVAATAVALYSAQTAEAASVAAAADLGRPPYDQMILADGPGAYWRLGETSSAGGNTFTDDFTTFTGWSNQPQGGAVVAEPTPPSAGPGSGGPAVRKVSNNDPAGGVKPLGFAVDDFTLRAWVYRPTPVAGGQVDRISVETAAGNGYGVFFDHGSDRIGIERRTGGSPGPDSGGTGLPDQLDTWYFVELTKVGPSLAVTVFDTSFAVLATATWSDTAHAGGFTTAAIRGGNEYLVDDLQVEEGAAAPVVAADSSGNGNDGTYLPVVAPASGLVVDPDTGDGSIDFAGGGVQVPDSPDINVGARDERTLSVWFEPVPAGRQLVYEEGGTVNGLNLYLDGTTLYARAWNAGWNPGELQVTATVSGGVHHVGMVLDAPGGTLDVYLDGTLIGTATKGDTGDWNSHTDDTGIGRVNGSTKFHDGNSSAPTPFGGRIDEVAVFNTALSTAQVVEHWANGTG